jgi:hypothetical protein
MKTAYVLMAEWIDSEGAEKHDVWAICDSIEKIDEARKALDEYLQRTFNDETEDDRDRQEFVKGIQQVYVNTFNVNSCYDVVGLVQ